MAALFDTQINAFRCATETTIDLSEIIGMSLDHFVDWLDELEGADYGEERLGVDAAGVTLKLGPLMEQECVPIGVTGDAEIVVRITGIREGTRAGSSGSA